MSYSFADLLTSVKTITKRSGLADATITESVRQAEAIINRDVRADEMVTVAALGESDRDSGPVYNLPAGLTEVRSITGTINSNTYQLTAVGSAELNQYGSTNEPLFFTVIGNSQVEFRGTPDTDTAFTLTYYKALTELTGSNTNDVLTYHRDLYLSGTLHYLYEYLEDLDMSEYYGNKFRNGIDRMNAHSTRTRSGRTGRSGNLGNILAGSSM